MAKELDRNQCINGRLQKLFQGGRQWRTQANLVRRMRYRFAMNPMLHRTVLRKSITFAYVHLRGNKS